MAPGTKLNITTLSARYPAKNGRYTLLGALITPALMLTYPLRVIVSQSRSTIKKYHCPYLLYRTKRK